MGEVIDLGNLLMIETVRERIRRLNELLDLLDQTDEAIAEEMEYINAIQQTPEA